VRSIRRFLPRPETLTVGATLLAAIAAAFSAWTALLQQRATFTSILYGKQIEEVAKFHEAAQKAMDFILLNSPPAPLNSKEPQLSDLRRAFDQLSPLEDAVMQADETLRLVVPQGYSHAADRITGGIVIVASMWRSALDAASANKADNQVNIKDNPSLAQLMTDGRQRSPMMQVQLGFFQGCTYAQLGQGHTLDEAYANQCVFPPPKAAPRAPPAPSPLP
jgi:hypothetical protein